MSRHLLFLPLALALVACKDGEDGDDTDETDASTGDDTTDDGTDDTTDDDTTDDDTTDDTDDTDVAGTDDTDETDLPFDPVGEWTLTGGVYTSSAGCTGNPTVPTEPRVVWTEPFEGQVVLTFDNFSDEFMCTLTGGNLECGANGYQSGGAVYTLIYTVDVSMVVGDGTGQLTRTETRTCTPGSGQCPGNSTCSPVFVWTATSD